MIERGGDLRLQVAKDSNSKGSIVPIVHENVDRSAYLMTDGEGHINLSVSTGSTRKRKPQHT